MGWEHRFRKLLLAGGALSAAACGGGGHSSSDNAEQPDATRPDASNETPSTAPTTFVAGGGCCNANPDPCCFLQCSGTQTDMDQYMVCEQARCVDAGGTYEMGFNEEYICIPPRDAGPDAAADGDPRD